MGIEMPSTLTPLNSTGEWSSNATWKHNDDWHEYNWRLANELNDEMRKVVLPVSVFVGTEAVIGFFGNILILYVFLFRYHICNFKYFVLCLSVIDLTSCLTTIPGEVVTQLFWFVYPVPIICKIKSFFNVFTVSASAMMLLVIAIDRHRKVCYPFAWQIRPQFAKLLCLLALFLSFIIAFPCAILWGTHNDEVEYNGVRVTVTVCEKDQNYWKTSYPLTYSTTVEVIICIQMFVMLVLYIIIARELLKKKGNATEKKTNIDQNLKQSNIFIVKQGLARKGFMSDSCYSTEDEQDEKVPTDVSESEGSSNVTKEKNSSSVYFDSPRKSSVVVKTINGITVSKKPRSLRVRTKSMASKSVSSRVKRKTLIMFILTTVFIVTTVLYLTLLSLIAEGVLRKLTSAGKTTYFFFFRLYFINHVINPFLYGLLDAQFRRVMKDFGMKMSRPFSSGGTSTSGV